MNPVLGTQYDTVGNLTAIGGFTFAYDAENGLVSSTLNSVATTYAYDGEGRRVKKGPAVMVYDAFGRLAAEYGGTADPVGTEYLTADHLGSTRLVTSAAGAERRCLDYLPFGEQMTQGMGGRGSCYASATEPRVKFTGKERDVETGLDYFLARYYSAAQGRFTSPDEFQGGIVDPFTEQQVSAPGPLPYADITDPQTLNKYAYVRNNPLRYVDPDGHCPWCIGALVGSVGGAAASIIGQKWPHPEQDINWKQVGAATLGGAVAGGTLGLATGPGALVTVIGGETILETGTAVGIAAAAGAGVAGGISERAVASGGDLNAAIGTLGQIAADAAVGAVVQGVSTAVVNPIVRASTTAGRATSVGEAKVARGVKASPSLPQRQKQLANQQRVSSGALGAGVDAANRAVQERAKKKKEEEQR